MAKKAAKATRKFAASGQLKKTIQQRRKHQDIKRKAERRKASGKGKGHQPKLQREGDEAVFSEDNDANSDEEEVDDLSDDGSLDSVDELSEGGSFASVDGIDDDEGEAHLLELSKLAEKDPEFYKYLQQNDRELLDFNPRNVVNEDDDMSDLEDPEADSVPILTKDILQKWQKALLEQRSLRALRKLLIAFRSAVHMHDDEKTQSWTIDSSAVYNKLVTTALKYTPVVLAHHCPPKLLANGKYKSPAQTPKWKTLQKLILSYFHNAAHLLTQLTDSELLVLALTETAKLLPYVTSSRKSVKVYLKTCLDLWSTSEDNVRVAAFLAVRQLASASDESLMDLALKNTYLTLVRACKSTSAHTLPSINLMKNSASELYTINHASTYQHAFGYVRQLAILLRNSLKVKTKESYKQVYNWQYVHCVDFWAIILARACSHQSEAERGGESELRPLIYPLVQLALGAIKLVTNSRSYPYHLHLTRSLLHLTQHTGVYVPLAPTLVPIVTYPLTASSSKASTLRPLDFETNLRAPQQYLKTRVYAEGIMEESSFLLAEYLAGTPVHNSVGYPELVVPVVAALRRGVKAASKGKGKGKEVSIVKALIERIEDSAKWVEEHRRGVSFAPGKLQQVQKWEQEVNVQETPLGKYVRVLRKARDKRRKLVDKAREGEGELLEE
ncbi:Noc2-domain-containing protein [Trametopsis cervina]|nr:Noc2-domain-containing protein [Trametopsis cervina]